MSEQPSRRFRFPRPPQHFLARTWKEIADHVSDTGRDVMETLLERHLPDFLSGQNEASGAKVWFTLSLPDGRIIRVVACLEMPAELPPPHAEPAQD